MWGCGGYFTTIACASSSCEIRFTDRGTMSASLSKNVVYGAWCCSRAWCTTSIMARGMAQRGGTNCVEERRPIGSARHHRTCSSELFTRRSAVTKARLMMEATKKERAFSTTCVTLTCSAQRVALRQWFSWMSAHAWHDPWWHLRLLMISAIGVFLRLWPVANAMPWLRPFARKCHKLEDSTEAAAEADAASKGIATLASASASDLIASTAAHAARMPLPRRQTTPMCYSLAVISCRLKTFDKIRSEAGSCLVVCRSVGVQQRDGATMAVKTLADARISPQHLCAADC